MFNVRQATLKDAEQIAKVHDQTWKLTYQPLLANEDFQQVMTYEHRKIMWETTLASNRVQQYVYVAEHNNGDIIGFISGGQERTKNFDYELEIYNIYVLKEYQGHKVGHELLKQFVNQMIQDGYQSLLVWILTRNLYGKFYVRYGAKVVEAENVTIGHGTYEETAYGWKDVQHLNQKLLEAIS
ncbi:GNAT family N-acetyltransferase [Aquisalibacillus elongatus]|uniref:L-amino acid N-acyltransferase YncA n=1 Tax=Aquisalibacillus elongatus TaxID=485577 RepID=A0A3N5BW54_9BACI|nr:GNAT family N-acetyltransferase [Aquisalibacillus elongatus]RPF50145.1 L-amino acid N-acyltransferase YncA [Aquisalibacillus elongatus]